MYRLPPGFDSTVLVGRRLEQICFTENQMALHFDGRVDIVVESAFIYRTPAAPPSNEPVAIPVYDSAVMHLLGRSIISASHDAQGNLTLLFKDSYSLMILHDTEQYECYQLRIGDQIIVV